MKNPVLFLAVAVALLLAACSSGEGSKDSGTGETLRLNLTKGQKFIMTYDLDQTTKMNMMGTDMETSLKNVTDYAYEVTNITPEGDYVLNVTYQRIRYKTSVMGMNVEYDSDNESAGGASDLRATMIEPFKAMKGLSLQVTMSPTGQVKSISGTSSLIDSVARDNTSLKKVMENYLSEEALKASFSQMTNFYPSKKVGEGDTWENATNIRVGDLIMKLSSTFTLANLTDDGAVLELDGKVEMDSSKPIVQNGVKVDMSMNGTQKGSMKLDRKTGWVRSGTLKQDIEGDMMAQGMKVPMKISNTITLSTR